MSKHKFHSEEHFWLSFFEESQVTIDIWEDGGNFLRIENSPSVKLNVIDPVFAMIGSVDGSTTRKDINRLLSKTQNSVLIIVYVYGYKLYGLIN